MIEESTSVGLLETTQPEAVAGDSIFLPKEDATPEAKAEQMGKIYGKLGRPDTPEGYKIEKPAELPEGLQWSEEVVTGLRVMAHKIGLNQAGMDTLIAFSAECRARGHQADVAAQKEFAAKQNEDAERAKTALKAKWGSDYEVNLAVVKAYCEIYKEATAEAEAAPGGGLLDYPSMHKGAAGEKSSWPF